MSVNSKDVSDNSDGLAKALEGMSEFKHANMFNSMIGHLTNKLHLDTRKRQGYFNNLKLLRDNWITNGIYDIIIGDLFVNTSSNSYFTIEVENDPELSDELNNVLEDAGLHDTLLSIAPDLLHYGSYPLKPVFSGSKGLVGLSDEFEPVEVVPILSSDCIPLLYFINRSITNAASGVDELGLVDYSRRQTFSYAGVNDIVNFVADTSYVKLTVPDKLIKQFKDKLPVDKKHLSDTLIIKQPKSFIWPAKDKLKDTLILDKVGIVKSIAKAISPTVLGVPVPSTYDPTKLIELTKRYAEILNGNALSISNLEDIDIAIKDIGQIKVLPIAGDRSIPAPMETGHQERALIRDDIKDNLEGLLSSLGIPLELFQGTTSREENLKANVRYSKKLKKLRKDISRAIVILCLMHIGKKYPDREVKLSQIQVVFKNNINYDELDNIESQDLIITAVNNFHDMLDKLEGVTHGSNYDINRDNLLESIKYSLETVGSPFASSIVRKGDTEITPVPGIRDPDVSNEEIP